MKKVLLILLIGLLLLGAVPAANAELYEVIALPTLDLETYTNIDKGAMAINNSGQIAGYDQKYESGLSGLFFHHVFWEMDETTSKYVLKDIGYVGTTDQFDGMYNLGINDGGFVVGTCMNSGRPAAYLWDPTAEKRTFLDGLDAPANQQTAALGINIHGQIVGFSYSGDPNSPYNHACLWPGPGQKPTDLATSFIGFETSRATGINGLGQMIIYSGVAAPRGFFLDRDGTSYQLNGQYNYPNAINSDGQVAGTFQYQGMSPFIWDKFQGYNPLVFFGNKASAMGINKKGQVVGWSSSTNSRAVIWQGPKMDIADLNNKIFDKNWILTSAHGVNDQGWIVGSGTYKGQPRAFLLKPHYPTVGSIIFEVLNE